MLHRGLVVAAAAGVWLTAAEPALAHEKWFVPDPGSYPTDWTFLLRPGTAALVVTAVAVAALWRYVALRRLPAPELRFLRRVGDLVPHVPRLLGILLGVSLLASAVSGRFLTHDLVVEHLAAGPVVLLVEGVLGVWLITGIRLQAAAVLLMLVGPLALLVTGPVGLLSAMDRLGVALFIVLVAPSPGGPPATAPLPGERSTAPAGPDRALRAGLLAIRAGAGGALITLAFAEKLANPALARETVRLYPELDVFGMAGLDVPVDVFVGLAGAIELLLGMLLVSGALPQVVAVAAAVPFSATLVLFGRTELLGHLPVYGVFLALIVYGSNPRTAMLVRWLPVRRRMLRHGAPTRLDQLVEVLTDPSERDSPALGPAAAGRRAEACATPER